MKSEGEGRFLNRGRVLGTNPILFEGIYTLDVILSVNCQLEQGRGEGEERLGGGGGKVRGRGRKDEGKERGGGSGGVWGGDIGGPRRCPPWKTEGMFPPPKMEICWNVPPLNKFLIQLSSFTQPINNLNLK